MIFRFFEKLSDCSDIITLPLTLPWGLEWKVCGSFSLRGERAALIKMSNETAFVNFHMFVLLKFSALKSPEKSAVLPKPRLRDCSVKPTGPERAEDLKRKARPAACAG